MPYDGKSAEVAGMVVVQVPRRRRRRRRYRKGNQLGARRHQ